MTGLGVRATCERVLVLRQGMVVEHGPIGEVFDRPKHPYTRRLLRAIPLPVVEPGWIEQVGVDESTDGQG